MNENQHSAITGNSASQSDINNKLFPVPEDIYGDKYKEHCLELYKVYISSAEAISERRRKNNTFFLTLNTAIIALISYVDLGAKANKYGDLYWLICLSGMVLCYTWFRLIRSYKQINAGKFKIIHFLEKKLPVALYDAEWDVLEQGKNDRVYVEFSKIEMIIPWIFFGIHFVVFLRIFPWNLLTKVLSTI